MEPTEDEKSASELWAFRPESRRFVLRDGSAWRRLVMRGIVNDPEMKQTGLITANKFVKGK